MIDLVAFKSRLENANLHLSYTGGIMKCPEKHVKDIFFT